MRKADVLVQAREQVQAQCQEGITIPDEVWHILTEREDIQSFCYRTVMGDTPDRRQDAAVELACYVEGALKLYECLPVKVLRRKPHLKPSAQTRYKSILHHVVFEAVDQFARRMGFIELENGKTVIQDFDIALHAKTIFASDIDWERVRKSWNRRSVGKPIPSVEAFQKTCRRALAALARPGKPISCERWLRHVCLLYTSPSPRDRS